MNGSSFAHSLFLSTLFPAVAAAAVLQTIEEQFKGTFDFFYLPIDFKNKCNVGYAFINMLAPEVSRQLALHGTCVASAIQRCLVCCLTLFARTLLCLH